MLQFMSQIMILVIVPKCMLTYHMSLSFEGGDQVQALVCAHNSAILVTPHRLSTRLIPPILLTFSEEKLSFYGLLAFSL